MKIDEKTAELIYAEFADFKAKMYSGLTPEERKEYGMVYTPAKVSIQMIERFEVESLKDQYILDPCCGSGNLLVACLLAGADVTKLCGNELNPKMVRLARRRIQDICNNDLTNYPTVAKLNPDGFVNITNREKFKYLHHHIHVGDATNPYCLSHFGNRYNYNMTEQTSAKEVPSQEEVEDNIPPSYEEGLLLPHEFGTIENTEDLIKSKWSKYIYKNIIKDIEYPVATDKELTLTKTDMEEIVAAENMKDAEDIVAETEAKFKLEAKAEAKADREKKDAEAIERAAKSELSQYTAPDSDWLFQ